jgi:hypothetical protein
VPSVPRARRQILAQPREPRLRARVREQGDPRLHRRVEIRRRPRPGTRRRSRPGCGSAWNKPSSNTIFTITCSALRATCLRSAGSALLSMRDPKKRMLRQTKLLFVGRLVRKSKGSKTKRFAFDKPQLRRRRPVREKPPSPSHDEGLD